MKLSESQFIMSHLILTWAQHGHNEAGDIQNWLPQLLKWNEVLGQATKWFLL